MLFSWRMAICASSSITSASLLECLSEHSFRVLIRAREGGPPETSERSMKRMLDVAFALARFPFCLLVTVDLAAACAVRSDGGNPLGSVGSLHGRDRNGAALLGALL